MDMPEHLLPLLNLSYWSTEDRSFTGFSQLPTELRHRVWQYALERHRFLKVIAEGPGESGTCAGFAEVPPRSSGPDTPLPADSYVLTVRSPDIHSKLLRVNRDSRAAALRFYRVHIPCWARRSTNSDAGPLPETAVHNAGSASATMLYFNPEWDFLQISLRSSIAFPFVDLMHDLKTRDPQGLGLLNIILSSNTIRTLETIDSLDTIIDDNARTSFVETMSQLRDIIWLVSSRAGRRVLGPLQGFSGVGLRLNFSLPIKCRQPCFDILPQDPRRIEQDLETVVTAAGDPRDKRDQWHKMLARWGIQPTQPPQERALFAFKPGKKVWDIKSIESADLYLENEKQTWNASLREGPFSRIMKRLREDAAAQMAGNSFPVVPPAIGFWLFPMEMLDELKEDGTHHRAKCVFDMRGHWPQLALTYLT